MKSTLMVVVLAVLFCNVSFAQDTNKEPADFATLKKTYDAAYEAAVKKATESLTQTYLQNLDKMKKKYGAAGDLKNATLIQVEIDRIGDSGTDGAVDSSEESKLAKSLTNTQWAWRHANATGETIRFDKKTVTNVNYNWNAEWKVVSANKVLLTHTDGRTAELTFDKRRKSYEGMDFDGHKLKGELLK
jgi:hypothetical protein